LEEKAAGEGRLPVAMKSNPNLAGTGGGTQMQFHLQISSLVAAGSPA
jgi:hypothetical protein